MFFLSPSHGMHCRDVHTHPDPRFNSSAGTILPEARESDIRSTSTSTSLDVDVDTGVGPTLGIGLHPHAHGLAHTRDTTHGHGLTQPRATAAGNNVASLSSARVLMPANTLGRELIELMQNQDLDGLMQSNSQESQEFASMVGALPLPLRITPHVDRS